MSDTRVSARFYPEEKAKLRQRAEHNGFSMSEYLRRLVEWEERQEFLSRVYPQTNGRTNSQR
jgi:Mobilization protein NikA